MSDAILFDRISKHLGKREAKRHVMKKAEYSLGSGPMKKAGRSGIGFLENGMRHIWDNLDPIPSDAKELIFTIPRFGDREGPWEFQIPLE